ncbi:MAG: hypothetical protein DHS20C21_17380 [Gemmatimonadota bacterium]|nr:MAG: hypothetical protein DHS20C21_17380 [Gemmatimonadota bacterium]
MKTTKTTCALVSASVLAAVTLTAGSSAAGSDLNVSWSDGIRLATDDKSVSLKIGGRLMNDWVFQKADNELLDALGTTDEDDVFHPAVIEDGTEMRRARMYFSGTVQGNTEFKLQVDFAGGKVSAKDYFLGVKNIPALGTIRVGHQYEPMGLDELTSSKYITFIERATPMAFVASRKTGLFVTNHTESVMWGGMVSRNSDGAGAASAGGEYNVTGRLAAVPWQEDGGRRLVHLGAAASRRGPAGDAVSYSARPENHLSVNHVSASVAADAATVLGLEAAAVFGPVSVQAEMLSSSVNATDDTDPMFSGWYAYGSWFLTGEHRPYKIDSGTFQRVKPKENFDGDGGLGAWELAARVSHIDLNDAGVSGGRLDDVTVALNWYLNPNFRWMANYIHADLTDAGKSHALLTRFQVDF